MPLLESPRETVRSGKAGRLRELQRAGFCVPEFVVNPADLAAAVFELGFPLAVRSSASVEDGEAVSFAGQFRSFLELKSLDEVRRAVATCRASPRAPSVADYCRRHGIDPEAIRMEVMIQRMVEPELAGVVFSMDPVTGEERPYIEACPGLADQLLAGRETPLPQDDPVLEGHRAAIETLAEAVQRHFGAPQDVEFAVAGGRLYLLQARPITRIQFAPGVGEWTNADFRDGGVSCGVCTPLMWSLYDYIWEDTLKGFLREIHLWDRDFTAGRMFFGRPYWNVGEVKRCLAKLPGFVERRFDEDLGIQPRYEGDGVRTAFRAGTMLRALPTAWAVAGIWNRQARFDRKFLEGGFDQLSRDYETLPEPLEAGFESLIRELYRTTETNYFRTIYCASLAKLDFTEAFPEADYASLMAGLPPMRHLEPVRFLEKRSRGSAAGREEFLHRFRHHSRRELDIRSPRWDEDAAWVDQLWKAGGAAASLAPRETFERARRLEWGKLSWRGRRRFARKLERLRHFVWLREEMRDLSSRVYYLLRKYVLELARRRGWGDDVFFMSWREILAHDHSQVRRNRALYEGYRNFAAPNEVGAGGLDGIRGHREDQERASWNGIGASSGVAQGQAHVVSSIEETVGMPAGAILVCPFTDPGWTTVLGRASAVVTETGGLLSHAAVICREFGIPAVLAVPEATRRIGSGQRLFLDGGEGWVRVEDGP
jgi:phosphohistidine swiveling domain-containing protein